jgi:hypothetical protein
MVPLTRKEQLALEDIGRRLAARYPDLDLLLTEGEQAPRAHSRAVVPPRLPRSVRRPGVPALLVAIVLATLAAVLWTLPGPGYCPGGTHPAGPAAASAACGQPEPGGSSPGG